MTVWHTTVSLQALMSTDTLIATCRPARADAARWMNFNANHSTLRVTYSWFGCGNNTHAHVHAWFLFNCHVLMLLLSLIPGQGGRVTDPILFRKLHRRLRSLWQWRLGHDSHRAWSCAGQCSTRCSAISSAPLQCGQVAESWRSIWYR